jgi:carbamate kinase
MLPAGPTIISLGGNAIIKRGEKGTVEEQFKNIQRSMACVARMVESGRPIIITHGNGPIVGNILISFEAVKKKDADSEGGIGFMIQQTLYNELRKTHRIEDVVTVVTQVVVERTDPAFKNPTKPIGPFYTSQEARALTREKGYVMAEDSLRGYRRVVASPRPVRVVEADVIKRLALSGVVVIAAGGGGVPVVEDKDGHLRGVDAVIDKDLATSVLAKEVHAEVFINLTQVEMVYLDFGKPTQRGIETMSVEEALRHLNAGEFAPGSMGPKIEAAVEFLEGGGKEVFITTPELVEEALEGRRGTRIYR